MNEQVFTKECKKRGFTQCGKSYIRVVGDGVFQHVFLGFKERLHSTAPGYSQNCRYEPRILIYLKSMYARYDGRFIGIEHTTGISLTVPQLLDKQNAVFMGAATEMERMLNEGLDILERITAQSHIVEHLEPFLSIYFEGQRYSTQLYDMYLYCEEFYKARAAIETEFAENYFAIMNNRKRAPNLSSENMRSFLDRSESYYERYMLTFPVQYDAAKDRLQNNYEVNSKRLRELGIEHCSVKKANRTEDSKTD